MKNGRRVVHVIGCEAGEALRGGNFVCGRATEVVGKPNPTVLHL